MNAMHEVQSLADVFVQMAPMMIITSIMAYGWLLLCRYLMRNQEAAFKVATEIPQNLAVLPASERITLHAARLQLIRRGNPSDRLFFTGLVIAGAIVVCIMFVRLMAHI